jgi:hypothetical protein
VLLVVNPWIFLTPAFDIHLEAFGTVFIVLAGRALYRGRTRASLLWVVATLSCGFVAATYVAGLAIGALLAGKRRQRLVGMGLLVAGALGVLIMTVAGQGSAFLIVTYGYLTGERPTNLFQLAGGLLLHPGAALKLLWDQHVRILVNLAPAGILGVFSGWGSGIALLLILANTLQNNDGLRVPSFQWQVVYLFVSVGTIVVLVNMSSQVMTRLARRGVVVLAVFIAADTVGWAAVWTPRLPGIWLRVSPSAAQELRKLDHMIPKNAPVIVSQGIVGDFPSHPYCFVLNDEEIQLPRETRPVWVVLAPTQGIETTYPGQLQALVTQLAESGDAKLVTYGAGIWGFLWSPPAGTKLTPVPGSTAAIGGWTIAGPAGRADVSGPPAQWAAESGGRAGYVVSGDYYHRDLGTYRASVTLSSSGPADIEVWDHTGNRLISKFPVAGTTGPTTESFPVTLWRTYPYRDIYGGWGPFRFTPAYIPAGNDLELRVWQPGNSDVKVYSVSLS